MSEDQGQQTGTAPAESTGAPPVSGRWGDPISEERQQELDALLQQWEQLSAAEQTERKGPFAGVRLTGADVFYLAARVLSGPDGDRAAVEGQLRVAQDDASLRRTLDLSAVHLEDATLNEAHLAGTNLDAAHLAGAGLNEAHLEDAVLRTAHLEDAVLSAAHLERAGAYVHAVEPREPRAYLQDRDEWQVTAYWPEPGHFFTIIDAARFRRAVRNKLTGLPRAALD
jgi:Pentapeptide repeats (8 copies)